MFFDKYLLLIMASLLMVASCKEELTGPSVNDGVPPSPVSQVIVKNEAGGALLKYTLPQDPDLLYVEAVYSIRPGIFRNTKSSFYNNNVRIEGFPLSQQYEVLLYAVDKGENRSEPVRVLVDPTTSPINKAFASLVVIPTFGGISITFTNEDSANIVITSMIMDSTGKFVDIHKNYTNLKKNTYAVRGLPSVDTTFGVFINDRFDNVTDTLIITLKPVFELQIPFNQITVVQGQAGDVWARRSPWDWHFIFDGDMGHFGNKFIVTATGSGIPQSFTMDFKKEYKFSRFKMWQRNDNAYYTQGPRTFELWGRLDAPDINDPSYDGWTKIGDYEHIKPSGLPDPQFTDDDKQYIIEGSDFEFELMPAFRYVRFKTTKLWGTGDFLVLGELIFWGEEN